MKKKKRLIFLVLIVAAVAFLYSASPRLQAQVFVALHGSRIQQSLSSGGGIPAHTGAKAFNTWEGEHNMTEFILDYRGSCYYGCYYSPDDVPLAFQNTRTSLTQDEAGNCTWESFGNYGKTTRIKQGWYYFEAHF